MTVLSYDAVYALARATGLVESQAVIATAIAAAESGLNPNNIGDATLSHYGSRGLWQIFTGAHNPAELGIGSGSQWTAAAVSVLEQPSINAHAMWLISSHGTNWHPWSTFQHDTHLQFMAKAQAAANRAKAPAPTPGVPMTATIRARKESGSPSQNWSGMCLKFVRTCLSVNSRYASAYAAWVGAGGAAGADTHTVKAAPEGVPIFWSGGSHGYGHIALSAGGGMCWSSDILRQGKVDLVPISKIHQKWGLTYLGWSETLNGVRVYQAPTWAAA